MTTYFQQMTLFDHEVSKVKFYIVWKVFQFNTKLWEKNTKLYILTPSYQSIWNTFINKISESTTDIPFLTLHKVKLP